LVRQLSSIPLSDLYRLTRQRGLPKFTEGVLAYDILFETGSSTSAKRYSKILELAAREGEARVNEALRVLLDRGEPVDCMEVEKLLKAADQNPSVTEVTVAPVDLTQFDTLFSNPAVLQ
jgi:hypothetical protein